MPALMRLPGLQQTKAGTINAILSLWASNPPPNGQKFIKVQLLALHSTALRSTGRDCWGALCRDRSWTLMILWVPSSSGHSMILKKDLLMDVLKPRNGAEGVRSNPVLQHGERCPSASTFHPAHFLRSRAAEQQSSENSSPKFVMFCLITVKQQHAHSITGKMRVGCFI